MYNLKRTRDANAAFQGTVYKPCRILSSFLIALPLTNAPRRGIIKTEDDTACGFQKIAQTVGLLKSCYIVITARLADLAVNFCDHVH